MLFFLSPQYCRFQNSEFNRTFPYQNERRGNSHKNINIPVFQICSRNNKTSLLYAWEVICLINRGVILPFVQKQGGILLKFDI